MIPKIIHYCWFGRNPLPKSALKCIASWRKFLPDYEIKEWNEDNFDVNMIPYTSEAYAEKKYAYVSDFARFWILYNYGGIYFDTDVEVIKPLDDILAKGPFMGCEKNPKNQSEYPSINPGVGMACLKGMKFVEDIMSLYSSLSFYAENGNAKKGIFKTVVSYTTEMLVESGLKQSNGVQFVSGFYIYPKDFFNPLEHINQLEITENTRTIHHYDGTWQPLWARFARRTIRMIGPRAYALYLQLKKKISGNIKK